MKVFRFMLPSICLFAFFIYFMYSNNKLISSIGGFIFIIGLVIYYLKALYNTFIVWKKDKQDGDQEAILEYIGIYSRLPSNTSRGTFSPGCVSASFKIHTLLSIDKFDLIGEIISLSGDVDCFDFIVGNKYKATMRIHSKKLINIEPFMDEVI